VRIKKQKRQHAGVNLPAKSDDKHFVCRGY
jgi:hypothetical protein